MEYDEQTRDDTLQTQLTLEDVSGRIDENKDDTATPEEISQDNVIVNPDPDSMESRG